MGDAEREHEQARERDQEPALDADPDGQPAAQVHRSSSRWKTDTGPKSRSAEPGRKLLADHDRAVEAAGAADRDREARLALVHVGRHEQVQQVSELVEERRRDRLAQDVLPDDLGQAAVRPELLDVVGVLHEPHVQDEVGLERHAVLEPEADELDREAVRALDVAQAGEDAARAARAATGRWCRGPRPPRRAPIRASSARASIEAAIPRSSASGCRWRVSREAADQDVVPRLEEDDDGADPAALERAAHRPEGEGHVPARTSSTIAVRANRTGSAATRSARSRSSSPGRLSTTT